MSGPAAPSPVTGPGSGGEARPRAAALPRLALGTARGAAQARRHSRRVATLKLVLPAIAVALVGVVAIWPQLRETGESALSLTYAGKVGGGVAGQSLVNARYQGLDSSNQPFTVTAEGASEKAPGSKVVRLTAPKADMSFSDGTWAMVSAGVGDYDQPARRLDLAGGITVYHDSGTELHTDSASVDLGKGLAWGDAALDGHGPFGAVQAQGFRIDQAAQTVTLLGKSRLLVQPDAQVPGTSSSSSRD